MRLSLQIIRTLYSTPRFMSRRSTRRSNPGLGNQVNAIEDAVEIIESDPESFSGLESNLFNAHHSYAEYQLEIKRRNDKIRQCIIKNKYFHKDPLPNLLTYAEKEHIRFLHSSDAEEWTVDKLSESFPANDEIIRKIIKARWSPLSSKRIQSHDASVLRNWERFKNGEYKENMTTDLHEHLKKFADRAANNINSLHDPARVLKKCLPKPISDEFLSIISLKPKKTLEMKTLPDPKSECKKTSTENETYILGKIENKKPITISELKSNKFLKSSKDSSQQNCNPFKQLTPQNVENISRLGIIDKKNNSSMLKVTADYTEKFSSNEIVINESDSSRYGMATTKLRVCIPRKLWRKGATYRVNNCYYDDDGEFLYSIPALD